MSLILLVVKISYHSPSLPTARRDRSRKNSGIYRADTPYCVRTPCRSSHPSRPSGVSRSSGRRRTEGENQDESCVDFADVKRSHLSIRHILIPHVHQPRESKRKAKNRVSIHVETLFCPLPFSLSFVSLFLREPHTRLHFCESAPTVVNIHSRRCEEITKRKRAVETSKKTIYNSVVVLLVIL